MRLKSVVAMGMTVVLCACAENATRDPPPGAVRIGDDHYMVPIGEDGDGCMQYGPWSDARPVTAAIYYRKAHGSFTLYRSDTGCGSDG